MSHFKLRSTLPTALAGLVSLSLSTGVMAQRTPAKPVRSSSVSTLRKATLLRAAPATEMPVENTNVERTVLTPQQLREAGVRDDLQLFNSVADIAAMPLPAGNAVSFKFPLTPIRDQMRSAISPNFVRTTLPPTLYSTIQEYVDGTDWDKLWNFPTLGADAANRSTRLNLATTLDTNAPTGFSNCLVFYGEIGQPADISNLYYGGSIRSIDPTTGTLTNVVGRYTVIVFDGVDSSTPPDVLNFTNAAKTVSSTTATPVYGAYNVTTSNPTPGVRSIGVSSDPIRINNPRGKFGILVAKLTDTANANDPGTLAQWIWWGNSASGNNAAWKINPTTKAVVGTAPVSLAADANFNQSARNNYPDNAYGSTDGGATFSSSVPTYGTLNAFVQLHGYPLGQTTGQTGGIRIALRKRGFNVPSLTVPEAAPGRYAVIASDPTSGTTLRVNQGYTQPSYAPSTTTPGTVSRYYNTFIEGYPVATAAGTSNYRITMVNLPIYALSGTTVVSDQFTAPTQYPGGDYFAISFSNPVAVKDFQGSSANFTGVGIVRFPRYADISDANGATGQDGTVDVNDLTYLLFAFNTALGDSSGLFEQYPAADIAGPGNATYADRGTPNNVIDVDDLTAMLFVFNTGSVETP